MASAEGSGVTIGQPNLQKQDLSKLDVTKLTALSPEVISRQATINIGTIGHVAHGKSTVVKAISGVQTVRFKNELERNITIKLERLRFDVNGKVIIPKEEGSEDGALNGAFNGHRPNGSSSSALRKRKGSNELTSERNTKKPRPKADRDVYAKEYVVEEVLGYKLSAGQHMFLIKWQDWDEEHNTWEPLEHLEHSIQLLVDFVTNSLDQRILEMINKKFLNLSENDIDMFINNYILEEGIQALPSKLSVQCTLLSLIYKPPSEVEVERINKGKRAFVLHTLILKRELQSIKMEEWQNKINSVSTEALIKVENDVDLECPPIGFEYITNYLPTNGIKIPTDPLVGCVCETCTGREKSCCGTQDKYFQYYGKGRINMPPGCPIYECNKHCKCDATCRNRVVQHGRKIPLSIFRTDNGRGWGVKTLRNITRGDFICEYIGEVITHEEAERRGKIYDAEGRTYLFDLDYNSSDNPYTVDAGTYGNVAHFINHSCDPNIGVWAVWIDCMDPNLPRLGLFALRSINKGDELTFDYKFNNGDPKSPNRQKDIAEQREKLAGKIPCKCSAKKCRRYLF